jgi:uncharacterized repeat protein (TIGR03803 family)
MKLKTLVCLSLITVVTSFSSAAHAQTFSVIHQFALGNDGADPHGGVTLRGGALYGTTTAANQQSNGNVYQITGTNDNWSLTPLFLFPDDRSGGSTPAGRVVFGPDARLYGSTAGGGSMYNSGVVFTLTPPVSVCNAAACGWKENVLYTFTGSPDGASPEGDLVFDRQGNIYGTTESGGDKGYGTVFKITKSGNTWTETPIWSFSGSDGFQPLSGVILDSNGNLFGTAWGGRYGYGVVFELSYVNGNWTETNIYDFKGGSDGENPEAGLTFDESGNLYGSTSAGGSGVGGTIFELIPSNGGWTFSLLYSLAGQPSQHSGPAAALTRDAVGSLYGTTLADGAYSEGSVFKLANTKNGWEYTSLHDFTGGGDGARPISNVTCDANGILYGTAQYGGFMDYPCQAIGCGTVWMIKP